jgi:hypothetical protein
MSEVTDIIVPILRRIQADVAELKRDLLDTKQAIGGKIDAVRERMDAFEDYFTYTMGLTQQNTLDIKRLRTEVAAIKARLDEPEGQR